MLFRFDARGEAIHSFDDFDETFLALALFAAGGRDLNADSLGAGEERVARRGGARAIVDMQFDAHKVFVCDLTVFFCRIKQRKPPMEKATERMDNFPFA
jgi:hypothetical protein